MELTGVRNRGVTTPNSFRKLILAGVLGDWGKERGYMVKNLKFTIL